MRISAFEREAIVNAVAACDPEVRVLELVAKGYRPHCQNLDSLD